MGDVIDVGSVRVGLRTRKKTFCEHNRLEYDPSCESVSCADCGDAIGSFRAFMTLVRQHQRGWNAIKRRERELQDARQKNLHRIASRKVDEAWRSRSSVPTCPHCDEPIFPDDGFGGAGMGRKLAEERRDQLRAARAERSRFASLKTTNRA